MKEKTTNEVLDLLLARLKVDQSNPVANVQRDWIEIVGSDLATHTRLLEVKKNVLIVKSNHSTWSQIVMMRRKSILKRINSLYPQLNISKIQVRTSS